MSNNDLKLNLLLKAYDSMSGVVKSACTQSDAEFEKMNKTLEATAGKFDEAGKKAAIFGGALVAASGLTAKMAGDFEEGMNNVSTLIDTNSESLEDMSKEILSIGKNSPKAISDLTDGLYSIRSAGIDATEQFNVLRGSEKLAVAGLATTAEAVDIATSAINAFGLQGEKSAKMYDMFFKVVKYGKTNISEFAQGFGSVAGVVAAADIQIDEYSAAVAAMTTTGVKANIAHTQMKAVIAGLSRASDDQVKIFNKLGAKSFKDLIAKSGGMVNALDKIKTAVNGDEAKIISLVGSVEAYNAVMSLTGATNKVFTQTLDDMRYGSDALAEAYAKQTAGFNNQMAELKNNLQVLGIKLGTALLPIINAAAGAIKNVLNLIDKMPDGLVSFISVATAGIGAISLFGGTALMFTANIIRSFTLIRNVMRTASIAAWAIPALGPIGWVVAGITALAAGAVYCYNKFEGFRNMCDGVWAVVKAGGAWLSVLWQCFLTGAKSVWDFISPAVKFAATILKWTTPIGLVVEGIKKLCGWIGSLIQKAGGLRGIGANMKEWGDAQTAKAEELNKTAKRNRGVKVDGSHADGLDYVPFDGYTAELHKGETVLSKPEADRWRRGDMVTQNNNSSQSGFTLHFAPQVTISGGGQNTQNLRDDFVKLLREFKEDIARLVLEILARREARAY